MAKKRRIYKSAHRWRSTHDARKLEAPPQVHLDVEHIGIISLTKCVRWSKRMARAGPQAAAEEVASLS
jgi:hypothetical protein